MINMCYRFVAINSRQEKEKFHIFTEVPLHEE